MACFHPMIGYKGGINPETGKNRIIVLPWNDKMTEVMKTDDNYFPIPCGKCIGCRQDYARQWTDRMIMEMDETDYAWFVTLTYDNDYVPKVPVLDETTGEIKSWTMTTRMQDISKFMKHVRKRFPATINPVHYERNAHDPDYPIPGIRFFAASEYGTKTLRPHYHLIIFNLKLDESQLVYLKSDNRGHKLYDCPELKKCWSNYVGQDKHGRPIFDPLGNIMVAKVQPNTINYVAQYTNKKASQDLQTYVETFNLEPPKTRCSVKPGLGWYWFQKNVDKVRDFTAFYVSTEDGSREIKCPEYFYRLLSKTDEEAVQRIKADKQCVGSLAFKRITESIQKPYSVYMRDKELDVKYALKRKMSNFNRDKI